MKLLRFYYFSFLYHYRNKPESWDGDYRSVLLVELSICWLMLSLCLLIDPGLRPLESCTRPVILGSNILILIVLQRYLVSKGRSGLIFQEFKNHPLNNQTNRVICWAVWVGTFILFILTASLR